MRLPLPPELVISLEHYRLTGETPYGNYTNHHGTHKCYLEPTTRRYVDQAGTEHVAEAFAVTTAGDAVVGDILQDVAGGVIYRVVQVDSLLVRGVQHHAEYLLVKDRTEGMMP